MGWNNDSLKQAGLQKGDIITKIDDTNVTSSGTITNVVVSKKPGDTVTLEVYHASSHQTSTVTATLIQVQDAG
jgi:serine protease Do